MLTRIIGIEAQGILGLHSASLTFLNQIHIPEGASSYHSDKLEVVDALFATFTHDCSAGQ